MNYKEAKKIIPKKEFESFETIFMNQLSRVPSSVLKKRATLARKLRDKYKDLAKFEVNQIHTRNDYEVDTDINDRRVRLFQDVIDTVESELKKTRAVDSRPAKTIKTNRHRNAQSVDENDRRNLLEARRRFVK